MTIQAGQRAHLTARKLPASAAAASAIAQAIAEMSA